MAKRFTPESALIVVIGERMLRSSHTLMDRSSDPDTNLSSPPSPAEVKTAHVTVLKEQYKIHYCYSALRLKKLRLTLYDLEKPKQNL